MTIKTSKGNITANKALLNTLVIALREAGEMNAQWGYFALAEANKELSREIYYALSDSGLYDKIRKER